MTCKIFSTPDSVTAGSIFIHTHTEGPMYLFYPSVRLCVVLASDISFCFSMVLPTIFITQDSIKFYGINHAGFLNKNIVLLTYTNRLWTIPF